MIHHDEAVIRQNEAEFQNEAHTVTTRLIQTQNEAVMMANRGPMSKRGRYITRRLVQCHNEAGTCWVFGFITGYLCLGGYVDTKARTTEQMGCPLLGERQGISLWRFRADMHIPDYE